MFSRFLDRRKPGLRIAPLPTFPKQTTDPPSFGLGVGRVAPSRSGTGVAKFLNSGAPIKTGKE
jgi:hypothetical protein